MDSVEQGKQEEEFIRDSASEIYGLPFQVGAASWGIRMIMSYPLARLPLIIAGILAVGSFILGVVIDLRFIIVGFMILLIVLPMLLGLLFLSYGLLPVNSLNIPLHRLKVSSAGIKVEMLELSKSGKTGEGESGGGTENTGGAEKEETELTVVRTHFLPASCFGRMELWGSGIWASLEIEGKREYLAVLRLGFREEDFGKVEDLLFHHY